MPIARQLISSLAINLDGTKDRWALLNLTRPLFQRRFNLFARWLLVGNVSHLTLWITSRTGLPQANRCFVHLIELGVVPSIFTLFTDNKDHKSGCKRIQRTRVANFYFLASSLTKHASHTCDHTKACHLGRLVDKNNSICHILSSIQDLRKGQLSTAANH
ncbi:hypothetical protein D3C80_1620080 [compost metagenome]